MRLATSGAFHEEIAGLVEVKVTGDVVTIEAPQPLSLGPEMPVDSLTQRTQSLACSSKGGSRKTSNSQPVFGSR